MPQEEKDFRLKLVISVKDGASTSQWSAEEEDPTSPHALQHEDPKVTSLSPSPLLHIHASINDHETNALIDSGASCDFIAQSIVDSLKQKPSLLPHSVFVKILDGDPLRCFHALHNVCV